MKNVLTLLLFILLLCSKAFSQTLYLTNERYFGTILKHDIPTASTSLEYSFPTNGTLGKYPQGNLIVYPNANLVGICKSGGAAGKGTIFEFDPSTKQIVSTTSFTGTTGATPGAEPVGDLVLAPSGIIYGCTQKGGNNDLGVLFGFDGISEKFVSSVEVDESVFSV